MTTLREAGLLGDEAAAQFRSIADRLPGLIWISGTDKLCTWFNKAWLDFVGRTMEQEIGNGWAENVHADDFHRCLQIYVTSFDAREKFRMEYRLRHHDGSYRWVLDEGTPLYDETGEFAGYVGSCLDITDQKQSEERESRIARALQFAFEPPFLPKIEGVTLQACYRPAVRDSRLGGDFYDAFVLRGGRVALSIGDIFGHGLEAAGAMVRLRETLRAATGLVDEHPASVLELANHAFQTSHPGIIASAIFAIYDPGTRRLLVANAGHPPAVHVHDGVATLQPYGDTLVGISPNTKFSVREKTLEPGDRFVFYTDGLVEVNRDVLAGERALLAAATRPEINLDEMVTELVGDNHPDDVAVLILNVER